MLLSGVLSADFYPLRAKGLELFRTGLWPIDLKPHVGYRTDVNPQEEAKNYATALAEYQLALSGVGMGERIPAPHMIAKHFEIPAVGTVMVTDRLAAPFLEPLGFIEAVNYLTTTPDNLAEDLKRWLSDSEILEKIALAGQKLVSERHSLDKRIQELEKITWNLWLNSQ